MNLSPDLSLSKPIRVSSILIGAICLASIFLFQPFDFFSSIISKSENPNIYFSLSRTLRLVLNDASMLILLAGWFNSRQVIKLAIAIQLIDLFILLPLYLLLKLWLEGDQEISSPLLSQSHRLIVTPTLMILLIPAVYFQQITKTK